VTELPPPPGPDLPPPPKPPGAAHRGAILESAFRVYRRGFLHFVGMAAIVAIPLTLLQYYLLNEVFTVNVDAATGQVIVDERFWRAIAGSFVASIIGFVITQLLTGALTRAAILGVAELPIRAGEAYRFALKRLGPILWVTLLTGLAVFGGFLLLIVPGIIFAVRFLVAMPALIVEDVRGTAALRRSWRLVKGNGWIVFGVYVLTIVVVGLLAAAFTAPFGDDWLSAGLAGGLASALATPYVTVVIVYVYLDLRARKEYFDRPALIRELTGEEPPPDPYSEGGTIA
jgi:hypothetical protein